MKMDVAIWNQMYMKEWVGGWAGWWGVVLLRLSLETMYTMHEGIQVASHGGKR